MRKVSKKGRCSRKHHIISEYSKLVQKSRRLDTTGWARWSTGNCARNLNLTMRKNGICTTQNPSCKMRHKIFRDFEIQADHLISARQPDLVIVNKKTRTCWIVNFVVLADHRVKLKEVEKRDKYLDLAREFKKQWNMRVTVIPIVVGALGIVIKGLTQGLEDLGIRGGEDTI